MLPSWPRRSTAAGVALELSSDKIVYAQSCFFHGHYVPHLVLQTSQGPATVLLLRHENMTARRAFHEGGMSGIVVPAQGGGGIAVLERSSGDLGATRAADAAGRALAAGRAPVADAGAACPPRGRVVHRQQRCRIILRQSHHAIQGHMR